MPQFGNAALGLHRFAASLTRSIPTLMLASSAFLANPSIGAAQDSSTTLPAISIASSIETWGIEERFSRFEQAKPQLWWTLSRLQVPQWAKATLPERFTGREVIRHQVDAQQKSSAVVLVVDPQQFPVEAPIVTAWDAQGSTVFAVDFCYQAGAPALCIQLGPEEDKESFVSPLVGMTKRPITLQISVSDRYVQVWANGQLQMRQEVRRKDRRIAAASWGVGLRGNTPTGAGFRGTVEHFALFEQAPSFAWFRELTSAIDAPAPENQVAAQEPTPTDSDSSIDEAAITPTESEGDSSTADEELVPLEPIPDDSIVGRDDSIDDAADTKPSDDQAEEASDQAADEPLSNEQAEGEQAEGEQGASEAEPQSEVSSEQVAEPVADELVPMPELDLIELDETPSDETPRGEASQDDEAPIGGWDRADADAVNLLGERIGDVRAEIRARPEAPLYRPEFFYAPETLELPATWIPVFVPGSCSVWHVYMAPRSR